MEPSSIDPFATLDAAYAAVAASEHALLTEIARFDPDHDWEQWGARDAAHWLAMRLDISEWKARRWICGTCDDGRQLGLLAQLPAAEGEVVVRAISRLARQVPVMPHEHPEWSIEQRRADALVALCSASIAADADHDRATVVVHTTFDDLRTGGNGESEGGGVIPGVTLRRLLCSARVQTVIEDSSGTAVGVGRTTRVVPAWLQRQIRHRDRECRFPACGARAFTQVHHIEWWRNGGRTDLDNLVLLCSFHHRLVHEHGWTVYMRSDGSVDWFDPRGGGPIPATEIDHPARSPGRRSAA